MNEGIWGWDYAVAPLVPQWHKIHLDRATGNLQVDVITSGLPLGGATAANQALIIADTGTLVTEQGRCYGWDLANWQPLRVESALLHNLRVRLYGGANAVLVGQSSAALAYTNYGLETFAALYADDGTNLSRVGMLLAGADAVDNALNTLGVASMLYGFNGTTWDRLYVESAAFRNLRVRLYDGGVGLDGRVMTTSSYNPADNYGLQTASKMFLHRSAASNLAWHTASSRGDGIPGDYIAPVALWGWNGGAWDRLRTWGTGILKVGRAEVGLLTVRKTAVGQVGAAGARKLYWMTMNPAAANSVIELTDDTDGSTAVVWDMTHGVNVSHHMNLDPPMEFTNGIWLKTFTNLTSIIFGYL